MEFPGVSDVGNQSEQKRFHTDINQAEVVSLSKYSRAGKTKLWGFFCLFF